MRGFGAVGRAVGGGGRAWYTRAILWACARRSVDVGGARDKACTGVGHATWGPGPGMPPSQQFFGGM
eukprot:12329119-Prorocentrum_lima.AAC.1